MSVENVVVVVVVVVVTIAALTVEPYHTIQESSLVSCHIKCISVVETRSDEGCSNNGCERLHGWKSFKNDNIVVMLCDVTFPNTSIL